MGEQGAKSTVCAANLARFARLKRNPGQVQKSAKLSSVNPGAAANGFPLRPVPG